MDLTCNRKLRTVLKQRRKSITTVFEKDHANDSVWPRTEESKVPKTRSFNAVTRLVSAIEVKEKSYR